MSATALSQTPAATQEIDNVVAFARLYGVVRYFHPSDAAASLDWNRFVVYGVSRVRGARDQPALQARLAELFTPLGPGIEIAPAASVQQASGTPDASLVAWQYRGPGFSETGGLYTATRTNRITAAHAASRSFEVPTRGASVDLDLLPRLTARVPLSLSQAEARIDPPGLAALRTALAATPNPFGSDDVDVRLADVVVAWNVFRHFYPYWPETKVDWDARLGPQLTGALLAAFTRDAHRNALRAQVADARDGHGSVRDVAFPAQLATLPIQLRLMEGRLVVIASDVANEVPIGSLVTAIDGADAAQRVASEMRFASGSPQWVSWRAASDVAVCRRGALVKLTFVPPGARSRELDLECSTTRAPTEPRPDPVAELSPGIWYVDLTRAQMSEIQARISTLASAKGVVFDLRGYPRADVSEVLRYVLDGPEQDRWMHVAQITRPFGQVSGWERLGWSLRPAAPRFAGGRVFLTDARAISAAESMMGYVRDRQLATIIGSATAGANGNVADVVVPGGFRIRFTGMRVTRHDGASAHHVVGVLPDIQMEPTLAGVRAGRDELLERALRLLRR